MHEGETGIDDTDKSAKAPVLKVPHFALLADDQMYAFNIVWYSM